MNTNLSCFFARFYACKIQVDEIYYYYYYYFSTCLTPSSHPHYLSGSSLHSHYFNLLLWKAKNKFILTFFFSHLRVQIPPLPPNLGSWAEFPVHPLNATLAWTQAPCLFPWFLYNIPFFFLNLYSKLNHFLQFKLEPASICKQVKIQKQCFESLNI